MQNLNLKRPHERQVDNVEDYEKYSGEFFDIRGIAKQLGEGAKAEDILKIMESLGAVVMKKRMEDEGKIGPFGFIRDQIETNEEKAPD